MSKILDENFNGVSQLLGSPNSWAIDLWKQGCNNNWMPQAVNMTRDIQQWKNGEITEDEKLLIKRTLGLFSAGESLVANSVGNVEWRYINDGACRQYLMRKQYEESLHNMTVAVCCEAFSLKVEEVAEAYKNIPSIRNKERFLVETLDSFDSKSFDIKTDDGKIKFIKNLAIFYLLCEGTWFFSNFAIILSLGRQNKVTGLCDQIRYTVRDESIHVEYGVRLINTIKSQYPKLWDQKLESEITKIISKGVELEVEYSKEILPNGVLGMNERMLSQYVRYLADLRLKSVGIVPIYNIQENPFPWVSEAQEADGMSAFFERREKNYQHAGALEDDF
jgi:ribonucleoside-diphosphate reductase beta chain